MGTDQSIPDGDVVLNEDSYGTGTIVSGAVAAMTMEELDPRSSVLFAALLGSARLHEKLGNAEALRAADRCMKRMERAVEAFGGRAVKVVGDELMAIFHTADDASQAAVEMQQRVADLPPVSGVHLAIRIGFSHGVAHEASGGVAGEAADVAVRLAGLAKSAQVLTCAQTVDAMTSPLKQAVRAVEAGQCEGLASGLVVFEVIHDAGHGLPPAATTSPAHTVTPVTQQPEPVIAAQGKLQLRYFGKTFVLDENHPFISLGRDAESDLVIHDRRASRHHAFIERRGGKVVLVDKSTNGSFVTESGQKEIFLRRKEWALQGKGLICFAASAKSSEPDCAEYELI